MDIKKKGKDITIKYSLKEDETYKIIKNKKFRTISFYKKPKLVKGFASSCIDGKHVLFIDYDEVPRFLVEQDYKRLQKEDKIPKGYLFATREKKDSEGFLKGNYHVICLSKHNPGHIRDMIMKTHADVNFMSMPLRNIYRNWVLRIGPKGEKDRPRFLGLIGKDNKNNYEISTAHLDMIEKIYSGMPKIKWKNQDKATKLYIQEYETMN